MFVCARVGVTWRACGGQRTTCESWVFPSSMGSGDQASVARLGRRHYTWPSVSFLNQHCIRKQSLLWMTPLMVTLGVQTFLRTLCLLVWVQVLLLPRGAEGAWVTCGSWKGGRCWTPPFTRYHGSLCSVSSVCREDASSMLRMEQDLRNGSHTLTCCGM